MKSRIMVLSLIAIFVLSACGQKTLGEPITLLNNKQEEVTFPLEKPTVFFFLTSYT
ncbi:hypothetical protein V7111_14090 [Neobacillus niacini]|uniref:hypothetical protein n=1 Tax=Neobacillus niacini TaxID=86668 RepID=UPI003002CFF8